MHGDPQDLLLHPHPRGYMSFTDPAHQSDFEARVLSFTSAVGGFDVMPEAVSGSIGGNEISIYLDFWRNYRF